MKNEEALLQVELLGRDFIIYKLPTLCYMLTTSSSVTSCKAHYLDNIEWHYVYPSWVLFHLWSRILAACPFQTRLSTSLARELASWPSTKWNYSSHQISLLCILSKPSRNSEQNWHQDLEPVSYNTKLLIHKMVIYINRDNNCRIHLAIIRWQHIKNLCG